MWSSRLGSGVGSGDVFVINVLGRAVVVGTSARRVPAPFQMVLNTATGMANLGGIICSDTRSCHRICLAAEPNAKEVRRLTPVEDGWMGVPPRVVMSFGPQDVRSWCWKMTSAARRPTKSVLPSGEGPFSRKGTICFGFGFLGGAGDFSSCILVGWKEELERRKCIDKYSILGPEA